MRRCRAGSGRSRRCSGRSGIRILGLGFVLHLFQDSAEHFLLFCGQIHACVRETIRKLTRIPSAKQNRTLKQTLVRHERCFLNGKNHTHFVKRIHELANAFICEFDVVIVVTAVVVVSIFILGGSNIAACTRFI